MHRPQRAPSEVEPDLAGAARINAARPCRGPWAWTAWTAEHRAFPPVAGPYPAHPVGRCFPHLGAHIFGLDTRPSRAISAADRAGLAR